MSALGAAYKTYLECLARDNNEIKIYDYCDEVDFSTLWSGIGPGIKTIIIVWDGRDDFCKEDENRNLLLPHLTPMDWALAFSVKQLSKNESPKPAIHIVDLTGKEHTVDEWSMWMRGQLLAEMSWVSLYTSLVPPDNSGQPLPFRRGYYEILGFSGEDKTLLQFNESGELAFRESVPDSSQTWANGNETSLKNLAKQWSASLTQSNDHHDINNVIGPGFLLLNSEDTPPAVNSQLLRLFARHCRRLPAVNKPLLKAFRKRIEWSELNPKEPDLTLKPDQIRALEGLGLSELKIVVIDDHVHSGWGDFVDNLLGKQSTFDNHATVFRYTDEDVINNLIGFLTKFQTSTAWGKRDFSLKLIDVIEEAEEPSSKMEIILLDLRMPALGESEIERLLQIATRYAGQSPAPAWRAFERTTTQVFDPEYLQGIRDNSTNSNDDALLLLHRLLAMALPLTPIVLFSVTGQAELREQLKPYRNILTNFEKPRPFSDFESVEHSVTNLIDCVIKGLRMQRLRLQLDCVQKIQKKTEETRKEARRRGRLLTGDDHSRIEIYADEAGDIEEGITSALAVCYFPLGAEADQLQNSLEEDGNHGIVSVESSSSGSIVEFNKSTRENILQNAEDFKSFLEKQEVDTTHWYAVATRAMRQEQEVDWENCVLTTFPDTKLDNILRFNLEFTLFVLIPYLFELFKGKVHINLATRVNYCPDPNHREAFYRDFNLFNPSGSPLICTWNEGSGFSIVRGWLSQWTNENNNSIEGRIGQLTALGLSEDGKDQYTRDTSHSRSQGGHVVQSGFSRELPPKPLHGIAGWVAGASSPLSKKGEELREELRSIFPSCNWFISSRIEDTYEDERVEFAKECRKLYILLKEFKMSVKNLNSLVNNGEDRDMIREAEEETRSKLEVLREIHRAEGQFAQEVLLILGSAEDGDISDSDTAQQVLEETERAMEPLLQALNLPSHLAEDANYLMDALRIGYEDKDISVDALRLILRSTCVRKGSFNKQQELILWKMKDKLEKAKGDVLHLVIDELN